MNPAEKFLDYIENLFEKEALIYKGIPAEDNLPDTVSLVFKDLPEISVLTCITYGLSLVKHEKWANNRPELMLSVKSANIEWALQIASLATKLRGKFPFSYGQTIDVGFPLVEEETEMSAFLIFAPMYLSKKDYTDIDVGLDYKIALNGIYPIYKEEIAVIKSIGMEKFWKNEKFEPVRVDRAKITG